MKFSKMPCMDDAEMQSMLEAEEKRLCKKYVCKNLNDVLAVQREILASHGL